MSVQNVMIALANRFKGSTLETALGGRIYADSGPADAAIPLLIWTLESVAVSKIFGGAQKFDMNFSFAFYESGDQTTIHTRSSQLETLLATKLSATGFDRVTFVRTNSGVPSFSDDGWTMTDKYKAVGYKG